MPVEYVKTKLQALRNNLMPTLSVDWSAFFVKYTEDEIFTQAYEDICRIMETMESNNLFLNSKSEVDIKIATKDNVNITGRLDFIHTYPLTGQVLILDGKGTDKVKKNVDESQLLFYALLYRFHFQKTPDELGFFYYRFNQMYPVEVNNDILNAFRAQLSLDIKALLKESEFKATPTPKSCKYCEYRVGCKEKEQRELEHKRPSKVDNLPDMQGVLEFSF